MQHDEIKGFTDQGERNKALVNRNKEIEERVMRIIDDLTEQPGVDVFMLNTGAKHLITAFMWLNRAVFQPTRVKLPEDEAALPPPPPVHIGLVARSIVDDQEKVTDEQGNELVAVGPYWFRKDEYENYTKSLAEATEQATATADVASVTRKNASKK